MGYLRLGLVLAMLAGVFACGGDDDASKAKSAGSAAPAPANAAAAGAGGSGPMLRNPTGTTTAGTSGSSSGTLAEGEQCNATNGCMSGLTCINSGLTGGTTVINVCARHCTATTESSDCKSGERCFVVDTTRSAGYCTDTVTVPFQECGPQVTATCDDTLQCLIVNIDDPMTPQLEITGLCVVECMPDAGGADAGLSMGSCPQGQTCVPRSDGGFCGTLVGAGAKCGASLGRFCGDENQTCFPDDPNDPNATSLSCHQTCDNSTDVCKSGKCTMVTFDSGDMVNVCI